MIIDFWNRNGGSPTPTPTDLSGVVASADLSGTTLNLDNPSGTTIDSVDLSSLEPDLTNYYTKNELDTTEETISRSLNDLNTRLSSAITSSQGITSIWKGTQAEYDQLTPDDNTIYIIITA